MSLQPLSNSAISTGLSPLARRDGAGSPGAMPFADLIKGLVQDTSQQQSSIEGSLKQMVAGEADSIHDVVLSASRADLAFRLVMEIRNRLISSYQEIMRMQV